MASRVIPKVVSHSKLLLTITNMYIFFIYVAG